MKLSINDMRAILKERTAQMVGKKASDDPSDIMAGVIDLKAIIAEIETYALELAEIKEELKNE